MSDFVKFGEMYFLHTFWNFVGPCGLQVGLISGSCKYCNNFGFTTTYISQTTVGNSMSHMILQEVYQRLCVDYNTYEEVAEEGS